MKIVQSLTHVKRAIEGIFAHSLRSTPESSSFLVAVAVTQSGSVKPTVKQSFISITNAGFRVVLGSFGGALWDLLVALRSRHGHRAQGTAARHVSSVKDRGERVSHQNYFLSGGIPSPCFKFWTTTCERTVCGLYSIFLAIHHGWNCSCL